MKYRHLTTGQVVLLIIGLIAILGICYALESNGKDDATCAFVGCNRIVTHEGDYCYQHDTYAKRRKATYGTSSSYSHSTSSSTTSSGSSSNSSSSGSNSSSSSTSSYKPSSSSSKYNSNHSYDSYDDGYDDVYFDSDYDQERYDQDDDYATGVDDAIEDDWEDGDEGDW